MMTLILGGLVTWRLAHMIVKESGPRGIFDRFRADRASKQQIHGGLFDMVSCVSCMGFWIAAVTALWPAYGLVSYFTYLFAFSAFTTILEAVYDRIKVR